MNVSIRKRETDEEIEFEISIEGCSAVDAISIIDTVLNPIQEDLPAVNTELLH